MVLQRICEEERGKEKLVDDGEGEQRKKLKQEEKGNWRNRRKRGRGSKKAVKWTGGSSSEHKQNENSRFRKGSDRIKCDEFETKKCISYRCIST